MKKSKKKGISELLCEYSPFDFLVNDISETDEMISEVRARIRECGIESKRAFEYYKSPFDYQVISCIELVNSELFHADHEKDSEKKKERILRAMDLLDLMRDNIAMAKQMHEERVEQFNKEFNEKYGHFEGGAAEQGVVSECLVKQDGGTEIRSLTEFRKARQ